jgi:hypothetical protein
MCQQQQQHQQQQQQQQQQQLVCDALISGDISASLED